MKTLVKLAIAAVLILAAMGKIDTTRHDCTLTRADGTTTTC